MKKNKVVLNDLPGDLYTTEFKDKRLTLITKHKVAVMKA